MPSRSFKPRATTQILTNQFARRLASWTSANMSSRCRCFHQRGPMARAKTVDIHDSRISCIKSVFACRKVMCNLSSRDSTRTSMLVISSMSQRGVRRHVHKHVRTITLINTTPRLKIDI
jgi:hypothetical protein